MTLAALLVALLAGCVRLSSVSDPAGSSSGPDSSAVPGTTLPPRPTPPPAPTPTPTPAPTPTPDDGAQPVAISLLDSMTIQPDPIRVEAGKPVRFVITNEGALEHDFFIGTNREQRQRERGEGEPGPDRYVQVPPGETVTLLYVFPSAGESIAGCVVPGHYSAGMRSDIIIE